MIINKLSGILTVFLLSCASYSFAQDDIWKEIKPKNISNQLERSSQPKNYKLFQLNENDLTKNLNQVKNRKSFQNTFINIPTTDGDKTMFIISESSTLSPELQQKYPEIKSYIGNSLDGSSTINISYSPYHGFNALIINENNVSYIDPYTKDLQTYITYQKNDITNTNPFICATDENLQNQLIASLPTSLTNRTSTPKTLRKYRLALSTTIEFSQFHINRLGLSNSSEHQKKAAVLSALNVAMTRVNGIYERDLGIRLELIPNNDKIIFITADEFTNDNGIALLSENQEVIDREIGFSNYDIGHVFSTGGGGVAYLQSTCSNRNKAGGVTGQQSPIDDPFYVDYVAHEMGHQFGANHTFTSSNNSCYGNKNLSTSMEPGSGSTIMGYAGICGSENVQKNSDAYFSSTSIQEINKFINTASGSCSINIPTNNNKPIITLNQTNYNIPHSTAFILTANATDPDNDKITYNWEQIDNSTTNLLPSSSNQTGPLFRSLEPISNNYRYFPNLDYILNNQLIVTENKLPYQWEVLPNVARILNFSLLVRDNNPAGGQTEREDIVINVKNTGPFKITTQETSETWQIGTSETINWDVAGTDSNGINTSHVKILISTNGGYSWDYILTKSTPNNGSFTFNVPSDIKLTSNARIMIQPIDNIYLAVNKAAFTIEKGNSTPNPIPDPKPENPSKTDKKITSIQLAPNPSKGNMELYLPITYSKIDINIYDLTGRKVFSFNTNSISQNKQKLNLNHLENGVYIITINADEEYFSKNIIIKK